MWGQKACAYRFSAYASKFLFRYPNSRLIVVRSYLPIYFLPKKINIAFRVLLIFKFSIKRFEFLYYPHNVIWVHKMGSPSKGRLTPCQIFRLHTRQYLMIPLNNPFWCSSFIWSWWFASK